MVYLHSISRYVGIKFSVKSKISNKMIITVSEIVGRFIRIFPGLAEIGS